MDPDEFAAEMTCIETPGLEICLYNQPPNSPSLTILDLELFCSMFFHYFTYPAKNRNKLQKKMIKMILEYLMENINNAFLTLQACMNKVIEHIGTTTIKFHIRAKVS